MHTMMSALVVMLVVPSLAFADSAVQWTVDRDATLISKDVGAERWAITYRLADGRVTGNVFRSDGGPSSFLQCNRTGNTSTDLTFDCFGAAACAGAPCPSSQYSPIASGVSLPVGFFFPPGDVPVTSPSTEALLGTWRFATTTSQTVVEATYRFEAIEGTGDDKVAFGVAPETGNRVYGGKTMSGNFVVFDETTFGCNTFVFKFVGGLVRVEGSEFGTVYSPSQGICTSERVNSVTNTFVGEKVSD